MIYRASQRTSRLCQGEIVSGLVHARLDVHHIGSATPLVVDLLTHPYAVVVTQDCDLEGDFMRRSGQRSTGSLIPAVLFCEAKDADAFRDEAQKAKSMASRQWENLRDNNNERYQYLRSVGTETDAAGLGAPALVLDFKRYFTVQTDEVYRRLEIGELTRRTVLETPYREHLTTRFFYYHYRVALPEGHFMPSS